MRKYPLDKTVNMWSTYPSGPKDDQASGIMTLSPHSVSLFALSLHWRQIEHDGVSNHQCLDCLLNHLFKCRQKNKSNSASLVFVRGIPHTKGKYSRKFFHLMLLPWFDFIYIRICFSAVLMLKSINGFIMNREHLSHMYILFNRYSVIKKLHTNHWH